MSTGEQAQATAPAAAAAAAEAQEVSLLDQVLSATKQTERSRAEDLMKTLVDQALTGVVSFDKNVTKTINATIKAIDEKLSTQLSAILHHPDFQKLEGTWRGLELPGHEQRDQCQFEAQSAQCLQARALR